MNGRLLFFLWILSLHPAAAQTVVPDSTRRYEVFDTREPQDLICQITVLKKNYGSRATAFLVAGNVLATAAHVLRESPFSKIITLTICVGRHNTGTGNKWLLTRTYNRKQLRITKNHRRDYAFVALPEKVSSNFFQTGEFDSLRAAADSFFITGYPEDKGYTAMWQKGDRSENLTQSHRCLVYSIFTWQGDSGAPVWCNSGDRFYAVGIHIFSNYHNTHLNAGVKFTRENLGRLQSFISQYAR